MRAAIRSLIAVLIITALLLIRRDLIYIHVLQDSIHGPDFEISRGDGSVYMKPPGNLPDHGFKTPIRVEIKTDVSRTMSVSTTNTMPETVSNTPAPAPSGLDRIVVIGRTSNEETSWVEQLDIWQNAVYSVDNHTSALHTSMNKGHEANVYLTYLVDNYHHLPSTIAFVHPHEKGYPQAWHTDAPNYSNVHSLRTLNIDFVQRNGYANLRCISTPGCPDEVQPFREPHDESRTHECAFPEAWKFIFENEDVPHVSATPCCAQFAVSKEQVLKRPLSFCSRAHQWLQNTPLDDDTSGRVFEYLWHIIFGQEPVYCPDLQECYENVYHR